MDNKVHANITDFMDNLSEDAEIRFVLVNNDVILKEKADLFLLQSIA